MKKGLNNITLPVYKEIKKELPSLMEQAIQADKDILSKITMEYDEDMEVTLIKFPKRIGMLSITINTHSLFLLNGTLVDYDGKVVEGYELDDYYIDDCVILSVLGDISEQIINGLVYYSFDGNTIYLFTDTYHLFFPQTGTKLYKHTLRFRNTEVEPVKEMNIDIVSIRGTAYPDLSINDKNYEILSYGYIKLEDTPYQVIGIEDSGMDSFIINYIGGGLVDYVEVNEFVSDTVTEL